MRHVDDVEQGQRMAMAEVDPAAYQAVFALERYLGTSSLEPALRELVKIRASQINGCAFCLDMHQRDARAQGESQRRLDVLIAWHEVAGVFSDRERAALALTEAVTRIGDGGVSDELWRRVRSCFTEPETAQLIMAIATINLWNRIAITTRAQPPAEQPADRLV